MAILATVHLLEEIVVIRERQVAFQGMEAAMNHRAETFVVFEVRDSQLLQVMEDSKQVRLVFRHLQERSHHHQAH